MKIISLYIALSFAIGCKGQTKMKKDTLTINKIQMERPKIADTSETIDLNNFKDNLIIKKKTDNTGGYNTYTYRKTDSQGNLITLDGGPRILVYSIKTKNSYYFIGKTYYGKSKNIQQKSMFFKLNSSSFLVDKEYFYNEQGKLTKTINHDLGWDFSEKDVVQFALNKGFKIDVSQEINLMKQENKEKRKYWILELETDRKKGKAGSETYKLDAKTGEVLFHSETNGRLRHDMNSLPPETIIIPDKTLKPQRVVYRTYDGKDYTQAEWKVFEQEQYNEHLRKTGRGDLIKPTETPKTDSRKNSFIADEDDVKPQKKKGFWK